MISGLSNILPQKSSEFPFMNQHNNLNKSDAVYKSKEAVNMQDNMVFAGTQEKQQ